MNAGDTAAREPDAVGDRRGLALRLLEGTWIDVAFVPAVVVALFVYLSLSTDVFFTHGNFNNVLGQAVMLATVAFGMTFVIIAREIDLSVGAGAAIVSVLTATPSAVGPPPRVVPGLIWSVFAPSVFTWPVICCWTPLPSAVSKITAEIPITIPSVVSAVNKLPNSIASGPFHGSWANLSTVAMTRPGMRR